jgi:MinD-like ATPase involved in chromosome partitioning or flagellar assembly
MDSPVAQPLIVTFYSYKGGTGRSMALANVAWILAANDQRVAVIDWDLEAPGLHRYLHPYLRDPDLTDSTGIIDFVMAYSREAIKPAKHGTKTSWYVPYANLLRHATSLRWDFGSKGTIDFIPSGRQGPDYAARVNSFNWSTFYEKHQGGLFLEAAKQSLSRYDYVLIDSRTGVSDTSGICTVQMPHVLVVCFTPNTQSILGASAIARSADQQRTRADGTRTLTILPVMTRVLAAEKDRVDAARRAARERFDSLLSHVKDPAAQDRYWGRMAVPQEPFYAFEEVLAVFGDQPGLTNTMLASMENLAGCIATLKTSATAASPPALRLPRLDDHRRRAELKKFVNITDEADIAATPPAAAPPPAFHVPEPVNYLPVSPDPSRSAVAPPAAAQGTYRYWFYVSHEHDQADSFLSKFALDLDKRVKALTPDQEGFFDNAAIDLGPSWKAIVAEALSASRTFVPIVTPRFLLNDYCGKEWQAFSWRSRQSGNARTGILPVLWTPISHQPPALASLNFFTPDMPKSYREDGLQFLMRIRRLRDDYQQFLDGFARRLVDIGLETPVLPQHVPPLEQLESAFREAGQSPQPTGGRNVRFVFVVEDRGQLRATGELSPRYGKKPTDWVPYGTQPVAMIALEAAASLDLYAHFAYLEHLDELEESPDISVVVIDARALISEDVQRRLKRLDRLVPRNWGYLIVFDDAPGTAAKVAELQAIAAMVLNNARQIQNRTHDVHSDLDLRASLLSTMTNLQLEVISRAAASQPADAKLPRLS